MNLVPSPCTARGVRRAAIAVLSLQAAALAQAGRETPVERAELEALRAEIAELRAAQQRAQQAQAPGVASDVLARLAVYGDLRVRFQGDYGDRDAPSRNSGQVRMRLGATYAINDQVTAGARLVTGDGDDPRSSDVQLSNFADDLEFALDLAYARFRFDDLTLHGGKIPQPFARTDLVWDPDVNPQGVSASFDHALGDAGTLHARGLFFMVDERAAGSDSTMLGAQLAYDTPSFGDLAFDVAAGFYDYALGSVAGAGAGDIRSNRIDATGNYLSDFNLLDVIAGLTWHGAGERWPVRLSLDVVRNLGAVDGEDSGFEVDLAVGRASHVGDLRFGYGYSQTEVDAVLAAFSNDNTGIATNYRTHALTLDWVFLQNTTANVTWYRYRPDDPAFAGSNDPTDWLDRLRFSVMVTF